ncbi:universal stress protein [Modestobacter sp. I12A-02662]|uniref:universal stress protein n=1 Tax=Modestobacter sp. I12A-02662 TaxID=1730496 RepID=UPI0034DEA581
MSVLVGFIPTPEGRAALEAAITETELRQTSLIVVNASSGDSLADPRWAARDAMAELERELTEAGVPHAVEQRTGRDPVEVLVEMADDRGVDLVVIGLRRRSPVGKLLMGSAAQRILLEAGCPVLAVKVAG